MTAIEPASATAPTTVRERDAAKQSPAGAAQAPERPWLAHYDQGVPAEVEIPDITVDVLLRRAAERHPNRDALVFFGKPTTFAQLDRAVDAFAAYLRRLGLEAGDVVSLHLPTSPAFVISFLGTLRAGCVVAPKSPLLVERELEVLMRQTQPRVSVVLDVLVPRVSAVRSKLSELLERPSAMSGIIATGIQDSLPVPIRWLYPLKARREHRWNPIAHTAQTPNLFRVLGEAPSDTIGSAARPTDTAVLQCTGGTTGIPKAAALTHRNLVANAIQCGAMIAGDGEGEGTILCALPYFHIYGLTVAMNFALLLGLTQILHPRWDATAVLKSIDRYRPRFFPGVPMFYAALVEHPDLSRYNLSSVEACISGAAPLPQAVQESFEKLSGGRVVEGYGLTEASPVTHVNPVRGQRKAGTIGLPFPSTDVRIVDLETGKRALGVGEVGELCVRGPQVMTGYYERPAETTDALRDGWLYTGDIAKMDADGYFTIVDRRKEMVIVAGVNVYPREVEEVLATHPAIAEAAVVGIADPHKGEVPHAFVVLKPGMSVTVDELHTHCRANLAAYKRPARIEIRTELPKSLVGKVLKRQLVQGQTVDVAADTNSSA
ncbi:MAG TPA: long-chain fatty acid--CoA ligase [Candidatus Limnocylindrales bacterium]